MLKTIALTMTGTIMLFCSTINAQDKGPADIILQTEAGKKPARFPHAKHQETITCGKCHHGMEKGKLVAYREGDTIDKCASCHNSEVLPGVKFTPEGERKPLKLYTLKGAAHGNCVTCHKAMAKKDPALKKKKFAKCSTCHIKRS